MGKPCITSARDMQLIGSGNKEQIALVSNSGDKIFSGDVITLDGGTGKVVVVDIISYLIVIDNLIFIIILLQYL